VFVRISPDRHATIVRRMSATALPNFMAGMTTHIPYIGFAQTGPVAWKLLPVERDRKMIKPLDHFMVGCY
jgi:GR25 family glycosyltransferase involved in LPS biosynthesis